MQTPTPPQAPRPNPAAPPPKPYANVPIARRKKRLGTGWVVLIIVGAAAIVAGVVLLVLMLTARLPGRDKYALPEAAPVPTIIAGEVVALAVDAPDPFLGEADLRAYFTAAADFAESAGANTLVFDAKQGLAVWWRDGIFPTFEGVAVQDTADALHDPMAILTEVLEGRGLQLWLAVDAYTGGELPYNAEGKVAEVAELADAQSTTAFAPGTADYEKLLTESMALLPKRYAISGFVFTAPGGATPDSAAAFARMLATLNSAMAGQDSLRPMALAYTEGALTEGFAATLLADGTVSRLLPTVAFANPATHNVHLAATAAATTAEPADQSGAAVDSDTSGTEDATANSTGDTANSGTEPANPVPAAASLPTLDATLAAYAGLPAGSLLLAPPDGDTTGLWFFAGRNIDAYAGAVLGRWPAAASGTAHIARLASLLQPVEDAPLPAGFAIPQILGVNYPAQNARVATEGLFIMGTSDPTQPLLMNGEAVPARGVHGAFGIGVTLEDGENSFTFTQGDKELTLHVERTTTTGGTGSSGTGGSTAPAPAPEAEVGQAVRVTALITSALSNPDDDSSMNETFHNGAVAVVEESVRTWRGGAATWAYKLKSGDYILAKACEWIDGDGHTAFTGITALDDGGGEWLTFEGGGTPAAYVAWGSEDATLTLTFYDTTLALPEGFSSGLVASASADQQADHVVLTLHTTALWGYSLEYADGQTRLYLKKPPAPSGDPARPLAGVHVLLDAGHGESDIGAPGVMGEGSAPNEKDVNLALAQTIAYRLRQLGAEVSMTRTGDTALSLDDRLAAQTLLKPDFFISVHHNSMLLTQDLNHIYGTQVYYYHPYNTPSSKQYAQNLIDAVSAATGRPGGDARWSYFYVTRTTVCPSVLFEYGFMVNPEEFEQVTSTEGLYAAALATADAIVASLPAA